MLGKRFMITGATGLIGKCLVSVLLELDDDIEITIPVRSKTKAEAIYGSGHRNLIIKEVDLIEYTANPGEQFDYIVHCASPTSGTYMTSHPSDVYWFAIQTTRNLLEYARLGKCKGFVYISSIEFYGQITTDRKIDETCSGYIDFDNPRNCYPLAKQSAEFLCKAYALQYEVPARIARLTQTLGAGVSDSDNRVFSQFARSIIEGHNIVLHTLGDSAKPYCYTMDAVTAILYILLKGEDGRSYNVANEDSYISIRNLAEFLCREFNPSLNVEGDLHPEYGYAPSTKTRLSTKSLKDLGWTARYDLHGMFDRLIQSLKGTDGD